MTELHDPRVVLVISQHDDTNVMVNREIATVNYLMTAFPGNVFLCRGSFLLVELNHPRPARVWADFYVNLLSRSDALYCVDNCRDHPLADWALENEMAVLGDYMDLELFMSTPMVDS